MSSKEHKTIEKKIDELFNRGSKDYKEEIKSFLETLKANHDEAERLFRQGAWLFLLFWAAFYAIGSGLVEEAQVASLKISKIKNLLIAAPPVLGAIYYSLSTSKVGALFLFAALRRGYKHLIPPTDDLNLTYLTIPPTVWNVELYFEAESPNKLLNLTNIAWYVVFIIALLILSLVAVAHVSYLMWLSVSVPLYVKLLSIVIGSIFWLKGIVLWSALFYEMD